MGINMIGIDDKMYSFVKKMTTIIGDNFGFNPEKTMRYSFYGFSLLYPFFCYSIDNVFEPTGHKVNIFFEFFFMLLMGIFLISDIKNIFKMISGEENRKYRITILYCALVYTPIVGIPITIFLSHTIDSIIANLSSAIIELETFYLFIYLMYCIVDLPPGEPKPKTSLSFA